MFFSLPLLFGIHASTGFSAVAGVMLFLIFLLLPVLPLMLHGVPSDFGVPAMTSVPSPLLSIHAVVWHSAVDTGGKFAAAVVIDIPVANLKPISKTPVVNKNLWKGVTTGPVVNL